MNKCCGRKHAWDEHKVDTTWRPAQLRCLIIGENPGDVGAPYFYSPPDPTRGRGVSIRANLLYGLHQVGLIAAPTLEAFRDAGFLFDHAIRCYLSARDVRNERELAGRYSSPRAAQATHLEAAIQQALAVWVMGRIGRNAVATICPAFPRDRSPISGPPYPYQITQVPKFFVSRYLTRIGPDEVLRICRDFNAFFSRAVTTASDTGVERTRGKAAGLGRAPVAAPSSANRTRTPATMISRVWRGWTTLQNADAYEELLRGEIFPGIARRRIAGYRGIELLRRELDGAVEFVTIMWFDSLEAVRAFAGADYGVAVVPPKARALLLRFDDRSEHYEVRERAQGR